MNSIYALFSNVFRLGAKPNIYTIFITLVVVFNIILNSFLIPIYGIYGSAISTA